VVRELLDAGYEVIGLARSDSGAAMLKNAGADVERGALEDLERLRQVAAGADGVIHLAFNHSADFAHHRAALVADLRAVETLGDALRDTGKPFVITDHMNGEASVDAVLAFAHQGVRASIVALAPTVHSDQDKHGFVPQLITIARTRGLSAYVGDGTNRWPAVHRLDAANLYRLALERAPAGSRLSGRAEDGVAFRDIATVIGEHLYVPVASLSPEDAAPHFGFLAPIVAADIPTVAPASGGETRAVLGWQPVQPGLIADLEQGHYFGIQTGRDR
jgi:nucleoside-diphosphate-sugar epimerase